MLGVILFCVLKCYNKNMSTLIFIFIFILGTIIGSFLNVVVFRFNTGRTFVKGSSMCMSCSHKLRWYELIPVFSFLIQKGKCRSCGSKISAQYPIVEIATGLIFVIVAFKFLPVLYFSPLLYTLYSIMFIVIFSLLTVVFVYDIRHKVIPNKLSYTFSILSLLSLVVSIALFGSFTIWPNILNLLAGPMIALPFILIWYFSKGRLMGLGDGKLMIGIGWMLGFSSGIFAVLLSFWIGAAISIILMIFSKKKIGMKTQIPFAPFLIIATLATFIFNFDLSTLINLFSF